MPTLSPSKQHASGLVPWLAVPVYLGCCGILGWTGIANKMRWWIDEPFFRAEAIRILASPPAAGTTWPSRRIGTIVVREVQVRGGRVHFLTKQSDFLYSVELIYSPPGSNPPTRANDVGGGWGWTMHDDF